jgi:TAP-like protein
VSRVRRSTRWVSPPAGGFGPTILHHTSPATPLSNAALIVRTLASARLLTVAGYGHVLGGVPSACANDYITGYFVDGTLPPEGTVCRQDIAPFATDPAP